MVSIPLNPPWDPVKQELECGTFSRGVGLDMKMEVGICIAFDHVDVIEGEPVAKVLHYFVDIVEFIVSEMEAESERCGLTL